MNHGSLFSGIGGAELAAEWIGWENVFHCEINPFGRRVLDYYWPNAKSYEDITKTDFSIWRGKIDILTGGFPCQPFSVAGKRKGTEDDRNLWPEMLRVIREVRPTWIVGENVYGLISWSGGLVFEQIQADLEAEAYEVWPIILPACSVDAPHRRDRVWIVAYLTNSGNEAMYQREVSADKFKTTSNANCDGSHEQPTEKNNSIRKNNKQQRTGRISPTERFSNEQSATNSDSIGGIVEGVRKRQEAEVNNAISAPSNWENFPTQSPVREGDDGLSSRLDGITFPKWRNESIKGFGNAWVPQVAYEIFKVINEMSG